MDPGSTTGEKTSGKRARVMDESSPIKPKRITSELLSQVRAQVAERKFNTYHRNRFEYLQSIFTITKPATENSPAEVKLKDNLPAVPVRSPILEIGEMEMDDPKEKAPKEVVIQGFDLISEICMAHLNELGLNDDDSDPLENPVFKDVKMCFIKNTAEVLAACYGDPEEPTETPNNEMICIPNALVDDTFALDLCCEMKGGLYEDLPSHRMDMPDSFLFPKLSPSQVFVEREYRKNFDKMIENSDKKEWDYSCFHRFLKK